ncbi:hypothetical protein [Arcanobacterium hippocoleae]|uniref:hypothetical protein n=1 Tax=Arcanobacterium hippocoleae TaxID=149017 RepID=UPI00333F0FA7
MQYRATAYFIGAIPAAQSSKIPSDAKKIGSVAVKADGPKEIQAKFQAAEPGFVTVVWSVEKSAQGKLAELIHADWADGFGIPAETISHRHEIAIDTALSIRNTKSGTYLVDDVFITGFPAIMEYLPAINVSRKICPILSSVYISSRKGWQYLMRISEKPHKSAV